MKSARVAVCALMTCDNYTVLKVISELASDGKRDTNCQRTDGMDDRLGSSAPSFSKTRPDSSAHLAPLFVLSFAGAAVRIGVFRCGANNSLIRRLSSHNLLFVFFCEFKQRSATDALPRCHLCLTLVSSSHQLQHQADREC